MSSSFPPVAVLGIVAGSLAAVAWCLFSCQRKRFRALDEERRQRVLALRARRESLRGTSKKLRQSLQRRPVAPDEKDSLKECTVCLAGYAEGDILVTLPCTHSFHEACLDQWLQSRRTCPVCRVNAAEALEQAAATDLEMGSQELSAEDSPDPLPDSKDQPENHIRVSSSS